MKKRNEGISVFLKKAAALTLTATMVLTGTGGLNLWSSLQVQAEDVEATTGSAIHADLPEEQEQETSVGSEDLHQKVDLSFLIHWDDDSDQGGFRPEGESLAETLKTALQAHPLVAKNSDRYAQQDDLSSERNGISVSVDETSGDSWKVTYSNVPLFILKGTGNQTTTGGDNSYQVDRYDLDPSVLSIPGYVSGDAEKDFKVRLESENDVSFVSDCPEITLSLDESKFASEMTRKVIWNDNADVNGHRPRDLSFLSLHYVVDGREYAIGDDSSEGVTAVSEDEAKEALGALKATVFTPVKTTPEIDTHWNLSWKYLPKTDKDGNEITYSLYQKSVPQFYLSSLGSSSNVQFDDEVTYTYSDKFAVSIIWNDASEKDHRLGEIKDLDLRIYKKTAGSVKKIYSTKETVSGGLSDSDLTFSYEENAWIVTAESLKGYDDSQATNTYYVEVDAPEKIEGEDWEYEVTYDNGQTSNETKKAYANGSVLINLKGKTTYRATKVFQVANLDKTAAAQAISFRLWCYPNNKTAEAMSAVTEGGNQLFYKPVAEDIVACTKEEYQQKGYSQIALKESCFTGEGKKLDRFDALGYELKYCVTEDPTDAYQAVYPGESNVLENGEEMSNILANQKIFKVRKIWNSRGYNEYKKTKVSLVLQKSLDGENWSDTGSKADLSGFTSSVMAKEKSLQPVSKYEDGRELNFRVIERLTYKNQEVAIEPWQVDGDTLTSSYCLNGRDYVVTVRRDKDTFTVFNEVASNVKLHLKKVWEDSSSASWGDEDKREGNKVIREKKGLTLCIYRSSQKEEKKLYATVKVAVNAEHRISVAAEDENGQELSLDKIYQPGYGDKTWKLADLTVARSKDGFVYDYTVEEEFPELSDAGVYQSVTYRVLEQAEDGFEPGDIKTTVTNTIYSGNGEYHEIYVKKAWNDNGDVESRGSVTATVGIWKKEGETWAFTPASSLLKEDRNISTTLTGENNYSRIVNVTDLYRSEMYKDPEKGEEIARGLRDESDNPSIRLGVLEDDIQYNGVHFPRSNQISYDAASRKASGSIAGGILSDQIRSGYDVTVEENDKEFTITNTRYGKVNITASMEWKDGGYGKYRQYGWGVVLYYVDENGRDVPFKNASGEPLVVEGMDDQITAENGYKTTKNQDELTFEELPMFDSKGRLYTYSVHEFIKDKEGNRVEISITNPGRDLKKTHYRVTGSEDGELKAGQPSLRDNVLTQPYTVSFHHKAGGDSVDTTYYTLWYDQARVTEPAVYGKRVLASYQLYYRMSNATNDALTKYNGRMVRNTVSAEEGADNNYYQKVMFSGMPEFDEDGNHYEYYAKQQLLNNPSGDAGYTSEYYAKSAVVKHPSVEATGTPAFDLTEATKASQMTEDGDGVAVPEEGLFVNRIYGKLKISGTKEWKDMPDDTKVMGYPDLAVSLTKKSDYVTDATPVTATINTAKTKYNFTDANGEEKEFDKFDSYGAPYTYVLTEKMYLPGTNKPVASHLYHSFMNGDTSEANTYDLSGDYVLNNYYSLPCAKRDITIHKKWENVPEGGDPKATFILSRVAVAIGDMKENDESGKKTISAILGDAAKTNTLLHNKEKIKEITVEGEESVTLEDLPVYASNGQLYLYFLEEDASYDSQDGLPGFKTSFDTHDSGYKVLENSAASRLIAFTNENVQSGTVTLGSTDKTVSSLCFEEQVNVTNSFDSDTVAKITGEKEWKEDSSVLDLVRPKVEDQKLSDVNLKLFRSLGGSQEEISAETYDLVWSKEDGKYFYTITPKAGYTFPKYNKNGKAYTYSVKEEMSGAVKVNYNGDQTVQKNAGKTDENGTLTMAPLVNALKGSVTVKKKWEDGRDAYLLRDVELALKLSAYSGGNSEPLFSIEYSMSKTDKWTHTFEHLPLVDRHGASLTYKIREEKIGEDAVEALSNSEEENGFTYQGKTKNYQVQYRDAEGVALTEAKPSATTSITNKLTGTSLDIFKYWEGGDETEDFKFRPKELKLKLQYRVAEWNAEGKITGFGEWQDRLSNGDAQKAVVFTMNASNRDTNNASCWKKTVSNLPKTVMVNGEAKFVQYRAVELDQDSAIDTNQQMDSYILTGQEDEAGNIGKDAGAIVNKTILTNTYQKHNPITVYRLWNDDSAKDTKIAVYSANAAGGDKKPGEDGAVAKIVEDTNGKKVRRTITAQEGKAASVTFADLPEYNKDQKEIHYYIGEEEVPANYSTTYHALKVTDNQRRVDETVTPVASLAPLPDNNELLIENAPLLTVKATKRWADHPYVTEGSEDSDRPKKVTFKLIRQAGDTTSESNVDVSSSTPDGTCAYTRSGLPGYEALTKGDLLEAKQKISYRVDEENVPRGYKKTVEDTGNNTFVITNTVETDELKVEKSWAGENEYVNHDDVDSLTFQLMRKAEGEDSFKNVLDTHGQKVTSNMKTGETSSVTFKDLPRYNGDGKAYTYCAVETALTYKGNAGRALAVADGNDQQNGLIGNYRYTSGTVSQKQGEKTVYTTRVTNRFLETNYTRLHLYKLWDDGNDRDGVRPETISLKISGMLEDAGERIFDQEVMLKEQKQWSETIVLPKVNGAGKTITYVVTEDASSFEEDYPKTMTAVSNDVDRLSMEDLADRDENLERKEMLRLSGEDMSITFLNQHPLTSAPQEEPTTGGGETPTTEEPTTGGGGSSATEEPTTGGGGSSATEEPTTGGGGSSATEEPTTGGGGSSATEEPTNGGGGSAASEDPEDRPRQDSRKEDSKKEDSKKEDSKKEEAKKEDSKKEETKKEDSKKEKSKKDTSKKNKKKHKDTKNKKDKKKNDQKNESKKDSGSESKKDRSSTKNKDHKRQSDRKEQKDSKNSKKDTKKDPVKDSKKDSRKDPAKRSTEDSKKDSRKDPAKRSTEDSKKKSKKIDRKDSEKESRKETSKKSKKESVTIKGHYDYKGVWHPRKEIPKTGDDTPVWFYLILAAGSFGYLLFGFIHFVVLGTKRRNRRGQMK